MGISGPDTGGRRARTVSPEVNPGARSRSAGATGGRLVVAEGHHPEGGLGSAVMEALLGSGQQPLRVAHLAVRKMPGSGNGAELTAAAGIDAAHIEAAVRELLGNA
jgi:transketolase